MKNSVSSNITPNAIMHVQLLVCFLEPAQKANTDGPLPD